MTTAERNIIYYGSLEDLPEQTTLHAGPLTVVFEAGDLRYIQCGRHEILRRIYAAVRDRNWGTIPGRISNLKIIQGEQRFGITFEVEHRQREIHFTWNGEILGDEQGRIRFSFSGEAKSTFFRNRIGFCVLHPMEVAGRRAQEIGTSAEREEKRFPIRIARHTAEEVPFRNLRGLRWEYADGQWARLDFNGDLFETEDQRNWIDASFKTFCTPLRFPFPVEIASGTRIEQSIELRLEQPVIVQGGEARSDVVHVELTEASSPLPRIGFGISSLGAQLTAEDRERTGLRADHLRVELDLAGQDWRWVLTMGAQECAIMDCSLELALVLTNNAEVELEECLGMVRGLPLSRIMIFHAAEKTTSARWVVLARRKLGELGVPIGGGSNAYFTELNRDRPPVELLDFLSYSVNPQVHAFDNSSLVETLQAHVPTVESAREFAQGKPVLISPITFRPRFNPDATGPARALLSGELPPEVDPRQLSLFGAAWTIGSIKYVAQAGIESVTYYETAGWRGLLESPEGSPVPERFFSRPGMVFPLCHTFADVGEFAGGEVLHSRTSEPLKLESLFLKQGTRCRAIIANLTAHPQQFSAAAIPAEVRMKFLDEKSYALATGSPRDFRTKFLRASQKLDLYGLRPFQVITFDWTA